MSFFICFIEDIIIPHSVGYTVIYRIHINFCYHYISKYKACEREERGG